MRSCKERSFVITVNARACVCVRAQSVKRYSLVSIRTDACSFVVFGAVHVGAVVKRPVSPPDRSAPPLVQEMPVETGKGSVLCAFVLQEQRALLGPELLQIPAK